MREAETLVLQDLSVRRPARELADHFGLSESGFKLYCQNVLGEGYLAYFRRRRLERAAELLRTTPQRVQDIAARVGQSPENVAMALESAVTPTSLYEPVYSDGEDSFALLDQLRDATGEESWISDMMFRDTVRALTPRERRIIALRYLNGKTQTQVAKEIGISQAQVSRLEKAALNHIKEQICAN